MHDQFYPENYDESIKEPELHQVYWIHKEVFELLKHTFPQAKKYVLYQWARDVVFEYLASIGSPQKYLFNLRLTWYQMGNLPRQQS